MNLEDIWNNLSNKYIDILIAKFEVISSSNLHHKDCESHYKTSSLCNKKCKKEIFYSGHSLIFRNPFTEKDQIATSLHLTIEETKKRISERKNRQFQWLLVEAYEELEQFLIHIYAYIGYKDRNFWKLKDYGNISLNDLNDKDISWYLSQAKMKKDLPKSIINSLKSYFPDFSKTEKFDDVNCNLTFIVVLAQNLRHVIVHNKGIITKLDDFILKISKESGFFNNGRIDDYILERINRYVYTDENISYVDLRDIKKDMMYYSDRINELIESLLIFCFIIYTYTKEKSF